jgi:sugar O-acyltransferase (sialic acid O-acetyltransferase NeuD family)
MQKIIVFGAGGFGREVAWLAEQCKNFEISCFVDDNPDLLKKQFNGIPVLSLEDARKRHADSLTVVAVGSPKIRQRITGKVLGHGFKIASLIHPCTEMSKWIDIEEGAIICAGCILTTNIHIKKHVQINLDCTIGHDVVMGDYTTLAPGVHVSGWVHFGKRVYVGTGAVIINGTEKNPLVIGDDAVIAAGAVVTRSVPPCETWGGVPAKVIRKNSDG